MMISCVIKVRIAVDVYKRQVFNTILLMNFFRSLPKELEEAAYVDGATNFRVLRMIILPVSKPVLATVTLFVIVNHWNSWFDGLIYLNSPMKYPLQTYLQTQVVSTNLMALETLRDVRQIGLISDRTGKAAQIFLAAVPVLMIYPFLQKYFTTGIVMGLSLIHILLCGPHRGHGGNASHFEETAAAGLYQYYSGRGSG